MGKGKNADGRKLVVLSGKTKGATYVLTKPEVKAGRESDNGICLKGKRVSRYHAVLVRDNGEYTLRDMSPRIGTLLNGRPTKEAHLKLGDRICIGEFEMSYEATTASPEIEEPTTPSLPVAVAQKESTEELAVGDLTVEYQRRIAELTQETERLVGEVKLANGILENVSGQLQTQTDLHADMTERLGIVSRENAALTERNGELQGRISELEASAKEAARLEVDLAVARAALHLMSEELAKVREVTKPVAVAEPVVPAVPMKAAEPAKEVVQIQPAPAEARSEPEKISDPPAPIKQVAAEKQELPLAEVKPREESVLTELSVSDRTNEQFDRIRKSMVEKRDQKPEKTGSVRALLSKFLRA